MLTHTIPGPPPGAGVALVDAAVLPRVAGAGLAATSVFAFLRARVLPGDGEAVGDSAVDGDAASLAGVAVAFSGEGDAAGDSSGVGDCPCTREMPARPITDIRARNLVVISRI
jgi:hypothetical protein